MEHTIRTGNNDPMRMMTYKPDSADPVDYGKKRVGGPKQQWVFQTDNLVYEKQIAYEGSYDSSQNQNNAFYNRAAIKVVRSVPANNNY